MDDHADNVIYGKIEEFKSYSIQEIDRYEAEKSYEIEIDEHVSIAKSGLSNYFNDRFKSSKEEYELAKERALEFIKQC